MVLETRLSRNFCGMYVLRDVQTDAKGKNFTCKTVKRKVDSLHAADPGGRIMSVVASGHVSDDREKQIKELNEMAERVLTV